MKITKNNPNLGLAFTIALAVKVTLAVLSLFGMTWLLGFWLPLAVMLGYLIYGHLQTKNKSRADRLNYGDSCYYLGFLFTVASLIIALLDIGMKGHLTVPEVAIRFGAAMVTTLLGMAIRVWLVTFAKQQETQEDNPGGIYVQGSEGTEFIINTSMDNLRNFNNALAENLELAKNMRHELQLLQGRLINDQTEIIEKIRQFSDELLKMTHENINKSHEEFKTKLNEEFEQISSFLKSIVNDNSEASKRIVNESIKQVDSMAQAAIKGLEDELKSVSNQLNTVVKENIANTDQLMKNSLNQVEKLASGSVVQIETLTKTSLSGIEGKGQQVINSLDATMTGVSKHLDAVVNDLEKNTNAFVTSAGKMKDNLLETSQKIASEVNATCNSFTQSTQAASASFTKSTQTASEGFEKQLSNVNFELSKLNATVDTTNQATSALSQTVSSASNELNSAVDALSSEAKNLEVKIQEMQKEKPKGGLFGFFRR